MTLKTAAIISVYKRYDYIDQTIKSVLNQSVPLDQIIVVADNINYFKDYNNVDLVEANNKSYGKMIAKAIKNLNDDIDIVFFLDDDDLFDKNKIKYIKKAFERSEKYNIAMIHNNQNYIDSNGNTINDPSIVYERWQLKVLRIINSNNVYEIYRQYNTLGFSSNNSSIAVKKDILDKYFNSISSIGVMLDITIGFLALLEGNILHVPWRLTYFRIGSGATTSSITDYKYYLEQKRKGICRSNIHLSDLRKLYAVTYDCMECRKVLEDAIISYEIYLYINNNYFNCDYKANLPSWSSIIYKTLKNFLKPRNQFSSMIRKIGAISLARINKNLLANFMINREFRQLSK